MNVTPAEGKDLRVKTQGQRKHVIVIDINRNKNVGCRFDPSSTRCRQVSRAK